MLSRKGKPITSVPHIWEALQPLFAKYPDLVLDGELYADKLSKDFNAICSAVRKVKPNAQELETAKLIEYHVYDVSSHDGVYEERKDYLSEIILALDNLNIVKSVRSTSINNRTELDNMFEYYLEFGYEGQMVRTNALYERRRVKSLLKRKTFQDADFVIQDVLEGKGNAAGMVAKVVICALDGTPLLTKDGKPCEASLLGDWFYRRKLLRDRKSVIGKVCTVNFLRLGVTGAPYIPKMKR